MRRFVTYGPALVVLIAAMVALAAAPAAVRRANIAKIEATVTLAQSTLDTGGVLDQINLETRSIADATLPGVVHISSGRGFGQSNGAGWVYNDDGFIVTNAHVVGEFSRPWVEMYDGRVQRARVVGRDADTDIAVLKVDPGAGVFPVRRNGHGPLSVGDRVFAFGSPFSIKFSMSQGIISGLGRGEAATMVGIQTGYTNFIQTDAAMNPGNSGGPLVDVNGNVIGMNTAIANAMDQSDGESGQSAGIGFAIPLETIESVVDQLMSEKVVLRGFLGISLWDISRRTPGYDRALELGYEGGGVLVTEASEGLPAKKAGLQPDDIIVAVAGRPTPNSAVLRAVISVQKPGAEVAIDYWRDGRIMSTTARLGAARMVERTVNGRRQRVPEYIEGSDSMTEQEIRRFIGSQ